MPVFYLTQALIMSSLCSISIESEKNSKYLVCLKKDKLSSKIISRVFKKKYNQKPSWMQQLDTTFVKCFPLETHTIVFALIRLK